MKVRYSCTCCGGRFDVVFHPVIGYGDHGGVTRVDEGVRVCHSCIEDYPTERPVGRICDWKLVEEDDDD